MLLTFVDVVARYLFNRPIRGGFEITELVLLVLIFAGLPLVSHADEHVTMDFIDRMLPERAVAILIRAVHALVAAVFFFPHRRLRRHHRCPAHHGRPVCLFHGRDDLSHGAGAPLQGIRAG